jgi:glutaredoxin 3
MSAALKTSIEALVAKAPVVMFSKSYCPYCTTAKKTVIAAGITPLVLELDKHKDGEAMQAMLQQITGQRTVPNVWVAGKFLGGCDDTLKANGNKVFATLAGEASTKAAIAALANDEVVKASGAALVHKL